MGTRGSGVLQGPANLLRVALSRAADWEEVGEQSIFAVKVRGKIVHVLDKEKPAEQYSLFPCLLPSDSSFLPGPIHPSHKERGLFLCSSPW